MVFFGTPEFALPTLDALEAAGRLPRLVVTQPDRPAGRGRKLQSPPVAVWARERGVDLLQVKRVRRSAALDRVRDVDPQLAVVVAFGQIFPPALLEIPQRGCMNLHASLLPRYRGASPIAAAIAAGELSTGVTTMWMGEGLDDGPILLQRETPIGERETTADLSGRLALLGAELVMETLEALEQESLTPTVQDEGIATYAPMLKKSDGEIDWRMEAVQLFNLLRAYTPWPGLTTVCRERPVKLVWGRPLKRQGLPDGPPGTYLGLVDGCMAIRCGGGTVFGAERLQRSGKRQLEARDFAHGERLEVGRSLAC